MTTQTKKKVSSKVVALLLTALLLLTMVPVGLLTTVFAAGTAYTVTVTDTADGKLEGATVTLTPTDAEQAGTYTYTVSTDVNGEAVFTDLTDAVNADDTLSIAYTVTVEKEGYQYYGDPIGVTVSKANATGGETVKLTKVYAFSIVHDTAAADITVDGQVYDGATMAVLPAGAHTVNIAPKAGYVYTGATKNGADATDAFAANTDIALDLTEDTALGFSFTQQFVITVNYGADGTVTYDGGVPVTDGGKVYAKSGTDKTFCFAAEANYKLASVTVDAVDVTADVTDGEYTLTSIDADHTMTVVFEKVTYTVKAYAHIINANGESNQPNTIYGTVKLSADGISSTDITAADGKTKIGEKIEIPFDKALTVTFVPADKSVSNVYQLQKFTVNGNTQFENEKASTKKEYTMQNITCDLELKAYFSNVPQAETAAEPTELITLTGANLSTFEKKATDGTVTDVYYVYSPAQDGSVWVRPVNPRAIIDLCGKTLSDNAPHYFGETKIYKTSEEISFNKIHVIENGVQTVYKLNKTVHVVFDKTAPVLADGDVVFAATPASYTDKTGTQYKDGKIEFTVTAKDAKTYDALTDRYVDDCKVSDAGAYNGIKSVSYQVTKQGDTTATVLAAKTVDISKADSASGTASVFTCPLDMTGYETGTYVLSFTAKDMAGNTSAPLTKTIVIDNTAPTLAEGQAITFTQKNDGVIAKTLNMLTFGYFFNEKFEIKVATADGQTAVASAKVNFYDESAPTKVAFGSAENTAPNKNGEFTFTVDRTQLANFKGKVCVVLTDAVGNVSEEFIATTANSNLTADALAATFMVENTAPTVQIDAASQEVTVANNMSLDFSATDKVAGEKYYAGINRVNIYMNEGTQPTWVYNYSDNETVTTDVSLSLPITVKEETGKTVQAKLDEKVLDFIADGESEPKVTLSIEVVDNAGNVSERTQVVYRKDTTTPVITKFEFTPIDGRTETGTAVEPTDYGFWFHVETEVTITAEDFAMGNEVPTGVQSITYYIDDVENGNTAPITNDVTDGKISFTIPANFKGQIYAMATDKVGNTPKTCGQFPTDYEDMPINEEGFVHPASTVIEDADKHTDTSSIAIRPTVQSVGTENYAFAFNTAQITEAQFDKEMTVNDAQKVPLYNTAVTFDLRVQDSYSGIKSVETKLYYKDIDGTQKADAVSVNWVTVKEQNLVLAQTAEITIPNNYNDMTLVLVLTDNAGNVSYDYYTFGIDTTAPIINVEYSNNKSDTQYTDYFNADRIATITIQERNLDLVSVQEDIARVLYEITNTDGVIPTLVGFEAVNIDENNPDNNVYQATIAYTADGDYTFTISCTDRAENANNGVNYGDSVAPETFTIDKTLPVVTVVYDNNTSKTGTNFYDAQRVATITVQEHNFDVARVLVTGTANDDGAPFAFPATSVWTHNGDTHTATITYAADGKYAFDIAFADMASNNAADYAGDEFYIDNTDPVPTITDTDNGPNGSAFNGDVVPKITCFDKNIDVNRITVTLSGTDKYGNAIHVSWSDSLQESMSDENTKNYALNCLNAKVANAYNKLFDGDYTLRVEMTDLAGRTAFDEKHFSVNRFGSDYVLTAPQDVNGRYVTSTGDLVIEEINVNALDRTQIVVTLYTADQAGKTLVEGVDYTLEQIGKINRYTIFAKNFENDSVYTLTIYSVDAAGNKNDSTDESKELKIEFVIDKVPPVITSETLDTTERKNNRPKAESLDAVFAVTDNHEVNVDSLTFTVDGNPVQYTVDDAGKYHIVLTESKNWQTVSVSVQDTAGQAAEAVEAQVLVTTNLFIRWYSNTPLFVGSLAGGAAVVAVAVALVVKRKKKIDA